MRLADMSIGLRLRLGLGIILALLAALGAMAWDQTQSMWEETRNLYDHPFMVSRALGEIKSRVAAMNMSTKGLCLTKDDPNRARIIKDIEGYDAEAHQRLNTVVAARYLGPRADLEALNLALAHWRAYREETIRLLRLGNVAEAIARSSPPREVDPYLAVMTPLQTMIDFANDKATQFYEQARQHKDGMLLNTATTLGLALLLAMLISYLLLKAIRNPLRDLTRVAQEYGLGRLDVRGQVEGRNEFGALTAALNAMLDRIQQQSDRQRQAGQLAAALLREEELVPFSQILLATLLELTGAQAAALYLLDEDRRHYGHLHSIGLGQGARASFSALELEGEIGPALASRRLQRLADIPADTPFSLPTASGSFRPREIVTLPIVVGQEVEVVVSLISLRGYDENALTLLDDVQGMLSARLGGVLAFRRINQMAERLEGQNQELEAQGRELKALADELGEQNLELEMQKRQLDQASRLKSSFLANMSHELRTPLNSVIALTGVLGRRLGGKLPEEEYGYLQVIERNGRHLLELINDILDLSRIESGREEVSLARFSVRELLDEAVALLEPQALEKNLLLQARVEGDLPAIRSDQAKCGHILQNLLGNAVKFTESGQVTVKASLRGETLRIAVSDTGVGIDPAKLPYIFDEFRQADDSTTRRFAGTGLGLAIALKYANLLGGGIEVQSQPGQGSTFTLWLPLNAPAALEQQAGPYPAPPHLAAAPASAPEDAGRGQGRSILVVEDSEPAVIQLREILCGEGYQVSVAGDGRQALALLEGTLPDAIILDLMMPEVDGFQVLESIRAQERTRRLPVLILSAKHVSREELSFLQGNHIHQLIQKGDVKKAQLLAAVAAMVPAPAPPGGVPPATARPSGGDAPHED